MDWGMEKQDNIFNESKKLPLERQYDFDHIIKN